MTVDFIAGDPREKARDFLDHIIDSGVDQVAIASAYCTRAGVQLLLRHTARLQNPGSFVVVSADPPTDYQALGNLHLKIFGNLFVHWGASSPVEKKASAALMHSKVFYARAGNECWLWTGSHNLTANATQGGNCEAAIRLHGSADEQPFVDALRHLQRCRGEATLYDPETPPVVRGDPTDMLVIHAEADSLPSNDLPWHVHLCLNSDKFDTLLRPPTEVRLILYPTGSLAGGWSRATPLGAYSGVLTGQNLTGNNPKAGRAGITAEWQQATFGIREERRVLVLGPDAPPGPRATTQVVIHINDSADPDELLLSAAPRIKPDWHEGETKTTEVDLDMKPFFTPSSLQGTNLIHRLKLERYHRVLLPQGEVRELDDPRIRGLLGSGQNNQLDMVRLPQERMDSYHPFIVRARFRLRG
jgi:hypothetical protein